MLSPARRLAAERNHIRPAATSSMRESTGKVRMLGPARRLAAARNRNRQAAAGTMR